MRLRRIKLAGFKSFVDPTTVELPSPRTAIIGPNGCGKSNIIDAVRWVMGESSAKQLRGDSMEDVIFNGSSARPPVSRASVDLVFDNSDHSLGGQWAKYSEIAIRREVTRDGQSAYFLNGTRCRRRDIADIFLGTGLGPRSYAIIEQGMISRIIEARPEELRIHLEEAAGITKYKERRRETETRIRHTRENLERLDDLRRELDKQIAHLARQAEQAERYKALKEEERRLRAEWLALRWRALEARRQAEEKALGAKETEVEAALAVQRELEAEIERARERHAELNEALNAVQAEYYRLGSDISRIEQTIAHRRETRRRHEADLAQLEKAWRELKAHVEEDRNKLDYVARSVADKEPALAALEETRARSAAALGEAEKAMAEWQQAWEAFHRREAEVSGRLRAEQARQEQLERHLAQLEARLARLDEERARLDEAPLVAEREQALQDEARIEAELEALGRRFEDNTRELNAARGRIQESESALAAARNRVQDLRGTLSSLEALQAAALGKDQAEAQAWLRRAALDDRPRLAETLQVEPGWEAAVEAVLGETLEAVCVAGIDETVPEGLQDAPDGLCLVAPQDAPEPGDRLLARLRAGAEYLGEALAGVYAAEDLAAAAAVRGRLAPGESVVTRDGLWLGRNWLRVPARGGEQAGVLARAQQIKALRREREDAEAAVGRLESALAEAREALAAAERAREALQNTRSELEQRRAALRAALRAVEVRLEQLQKRRNELAREREELTRQIESDRRAREAAQREREAARAESESLAAERGRLETRRTELAEALEAARRTAQADQQAVHEAALNIQSMRSMKESTERSLLRMQQQLDHLESRRGELLAALNEDHEPVAELEQQLAALLERRVAEEARLNAARAEAEEAANAVRELEQRRGEQARRVGELREALDALRLAAQEARVRAQALAEQFDETGLDRAAVLAELPEDADPDAWAEKLHKVEARIARLGPINLAAIDEHREQAERKAYLDKQHADLTEALETLERAITKIDRETRARFKDVFDRVNAALKDMFPRLFGGGHAHLEMTGDDLLSTGVAIMARPPGKRISNIHLLSGGEKALTAVAMVFAIFSLNPAPFCMLDEVDAPLDEANVARFNELLKEMSEKVQFIAITHNKTTMEMADQLIGVTMREPGVSRIVAVDIDEAVRLASA